MSMGTSRDAPEPMESPGPDRARLDFGDELSTLCSEIAMLREEVSALRSVAERYGFGLARNHIRRPADSVTIEAGNDLGPELGFYPLEHTEAGVPFCWTGPAPQFYFNLTVDRTSGADLQLDALNFLDFERQKDVTLLVDGEVVPVIVAASGVGIVITAVLPPSPKARVTDLVFIVPEVLAPPNPADTRLLGIAFTQLSVTPWDTTKPS